MRRQFAIIYCEMPDGVERKIKLEGDYYPPADAGLYAPSEDESFEIVSASVIDGAPVSIDDGQKMFEENYDDVMEQVRDDYMAMHSMAENV